MFFVFRPASLFTPSAQQLIVRRRSPDSHNPLLRLQLMRARWHGKHNYRPAPVSANHSSQPGVCAARRSERLGSSSQENVSGRRDDGGGGWELSPPTDNVDQRDGGEAVQQRLEGTLVEV